MRSQEITVFKHFGFELKQSFGFGREANEVNVSHVDADGDVELNVQCNGDSVRLWLNREAREALAKFLLSPEAPEE